MFENFLKYLLTKNAFTPQQTELMRSLCIEKKVKKNQILLSEGETARHIIFISAGLLRLFRRDEKGKEFILKFGSENHWITDRESLRYERPAKANIQALEDSDLLLWKKEDFSQLLQQIPEFRTLMKDISAKSAIAEQARLYRTMAATAEEKYLHFSEKNAALLNRVPLHMIASYLGLTRETLSRMRRQSFYK